MSHNKIKKNWMVQNVDFDNCLGGILKFNKLKYK